MGNWLGDVGNFFSDILKTVVGGLLQGVTEAIKVIATWWIYLPAPVLEGEGAGLSPAERVQEYTGWAVTLVGVIATMFALLVIARKRNPNDVVETMVSLFRVILVSGAAIPGAYLALKFSDQASPWLLNQISGGTFEDGLGELSGLDAAAASGMGVGTLVLLLVVLVISVIGGILNMILVMFSFGALPAVVGLLPVAAAYAMSERGRVAFGKSIGWLAALVLFKPVAAVIYGVGIASSRMISGGVEDSGQVVIQSLYGGIVLAAAGIALPVLIRLIAPAAAAGSQGAGAGGLLVGAAMVAVGALTGGASAAAGAAATGGGGAAATTGAATTGAAADATGAATGGAASSTGTSGTSGASGGTGTSGSSGSSGDSGSSGSSGSSGASGADGGEGSSGSAGTAGTSGARGDAGTSGASGSAGTSGATGSAGTGGASGSAGSSGGSGATGATPSSQAPSHGPASSSPPAERSWAERWKAEGAAHIRSQGGIADHAAEQGDDR